MNKVKIKEKFVLEILKENFPDNYNEIYEKSLLLQYLDKKMKAIERDSKARRSLGNIYAIYSILYYYQENYYNKRAEYKKFGGYD